ncbi:transposase [Streptomyces sp. 4F14]|uniref:transposase n=1 Tax=Streptomyces sp. 4F14 TaxID=3394380 RepID=UPI003A8A4264
MDEFGVRRGRPCAAVLAGMTTCRPGDVLADRTAHTFAGRLRRHAEVRVVCRDGAGSFRDGARAGAPQARRAADAWHLLHSPAAPGELDVHGRLRPLVACTRERHRHIHERIERGGSLRAIARELRLSRGTVTRFARAADAGQLLGAATDRPSAVDDHRLCLHRRWTEGCTRAAALTREIQQLGHRGDVSTVRRHLRLYRAGTIPTDAPLPQPTVRRVTDWIMRRPGHLTETGRQCLGELCERSPALTTTTECARRLAAMVRERRSEHLALGVWLAGIRLGGQCELRTLDRAAVPAALTVTFTSGAVEGNVTMINRLTPPDQRRSPELIDQRHSLTATQPARLVLVVGDRSRPVGRCPATWWDTTLSLGSSGQ